MGKPQALSERHGSTQQKRPERDECRYCRKPLNDRTRSREHLVPLSRGGRDADDNIGWSCRRCNTTKGSLTDREFRHWLRTGRCQPTVPAAEERRLYATKAARRARMEIVEAARRKNPV